SLLSSCFHLPQSTPPHPPLPSFPTRRSSDLHILLHGVAIGQNVLGSCQSVHHLLPVGLDILVGVLHHAVCPANEQLQHGLDALRSEEHTSELQSRFDLVCRLLLEKKQSYI